MDRRNLCDGFNFYNDVVFNDQIGAKTGFQTDVLVDNRNRLLLDDRQPTFA